MHVDQKRQISSFFKITQMPSNLESTKEWSTMMYQVLNYLCVLFFAVLCFRTSNSVLRCRLYCLLYYFPSACVVWKQTVYVVTGIGCLPCGDCFQDKLQKLVPGSSPKRQMLTLKWQKPSSGRWNYVGSKGGSHVMLLLSNNVNKKFPFPTSSQCWFLLSLTTIVT